MLFKSNDIAEEMVNDDLALVHRREPALLPGLHRLIATQNYTELDKVFEGIFPGCIYNMMSDGKWSMVHLLLRILKDTGPAEVWATTWSANEDAIRSLIDLHQSGYFTRLNFLFDYRVRKYRPAAYFLARENFNSRIASCHAKVTVIMNDKWAVSIIGSPNYTRNDRIEAVVIFEGKEIAEFHRNWISKKMELASNDI
jgi:hypothetical protein